MDSDVFRFSAAISIPVDVTPGGAKHPIAQQLEEKLVIFIKNMFLHFFSMYHVINGIQKYSRYFEIVFS